jgi:hypothetical protein
LTARLMRLASTDAAASRRSDGSSAWAGA